MINFFQTLVASSTCAATYREGGSCNAPSWHLSLQEEEEQGHFSFSVQGCRLVPRHMDGGVQGETPWMPRHGQAVQVDPIKPTLTAPGTKRLKLKYDKPLSSFAYNFHLRRYNTEEAAARAYNKHVKDGVDPVKNRAPASSQFKGVSWNKIAGKWRAACKVGGAS